MAEVVLPVPHLVDAPALLVVRVGGVLEDNAIARLERELAVDLDKIRPTRETRPAYGPRFLP